MFRLADITFHANTEYRDEASLIKAQHTSLIYLDHCLPEAEVVVIKHYAGKNIKLNDFKTFRFFRSKNIFGYFSFQTLKYLQSLQPEIILVRGLIFPFQVLMLRLFLGSKIKILLRHHGEVPFNGLKKKLQQLADKYAAGYLFTSADMINPWLQHKIIHPNKTIIELPATLTTFKKQNKNISREKLSISNKLNYLWVGRLHPNKDPITVLKAFDWLLAFTEESTLHIIYQTAELLRDVEQIIGQSSKLQNAVRLHGAKPYESLPTWFSAADFYISASHNEGGSSTILEAMACGCIPIVSRIPASMKVTGNGEIGLNFKAGNEAELCEKLFYSLEMDIQSQSKKVESFFNSNYSAEVVTQKLIKACQNILRK